VLFFNWNAGVDLTREAEQSRGPCVNRKFLAVAVVVVAATLVFGKSSKLVMSWRNPAYSSQNKFHRVLALGLSDKTQIRADFEDALAAQLANTGVEAVPANTILLRPAGTQLDLNYLREQIRANQIEAVVVSRLIKVENTATYIPGAAYVVPFPYYNTFYGYYGTVYTTVYGPGYLQKEKKVRIETNLYVTSAPDGQLVWTGITDTFNPSDVHKAIQGLVKLIMAQMQTEGVL
jgi:hypothetical protein